MALLIPFSNASQQDKSFIKYRTSSKLGYHVYRGVLKVSLGVDSSSVPRFTVQNNSYLSHTGSLCSSSSVMWAGLPCPRHYGYPVKFRDYKSSGIFSPNAKAAHCKDFVCRS